MAMIFNGQKYNPSSKFFEQNIHQSGLIQEKLFLSNEQVKQDEEDAAFLEECFKEIKLAALGKATMKSAFANLILTTLPKINPSLSNLFSYSNSASALSVGSQFEQEIAEIINAAIYHVTGKTDGARVAGQDVGAPSMGFTKEDFEGFFQRDIADLLKFTIVEAGKSFDTNEQLYRLADRQIKSDIIVSQELPNQPTEVASFTFTPASKILKFYNTLIGASFSAKNYTGKNGVANVHLGSTSNIRVYSSVLSFLGVATTAQEVKKIYYANRSSRKNEAVIHKRHLRFIYELTGVGIRTNQLQKDLGATKFLIVNERKGTGIKVFSTKSLIKEMLSKDTISKHESMNYRVEFSNN